MIDAAILRALQAAGATTDMIIAAIEADGLIEAERRERKRAGNRERQRRFKAAHAVNNADNALPPPNEYISNPPSSSQTKVCSDEVAPARKSKSFPCPEGVDPQHWQDFLANRKTKRLTNNPTAYRLQLKQLAALADDEWPPGRIVEFAAARGWGAIHDPRTAFGNTSNGTAKSAPTLAELRRAAATEEAERPAPQNNWGAGAALPAG